MSSAHTHLCGIEVEVVDFQMLMSLGTREDAFRDFRVQWESYPGGELFGRGRIQVTISLVAQRCSRLKSP
jgi:hypothetical protein